MSTQPLSKTCSTTSESDIKQSMVFKHQKDIITTSLPTQSSEWSIPKSITQLKLDDIILHEGHVARVTFTCECYVVVTPKDMQYGILVFPQFLNRVRIQLLPEGTR